MNLPLYIAIKYFFSKKKIGYVHLLSIITQVGIAIGTAALVLVLSVFNGFVSMSAYRQVAKSVMTGFQSHSVCSRDDSIC